MKFQIYSISHIFVSKHLKYINRSLFKIKIKTCCKIVFSGYLSEIRKHYYHQFINYVKNY